MEISKRSRAGSRQPLLISGKVSPHLIGFVPIIHRVEQAPEALRIDTVLPHTIFPFQLSYQKLKEEMRYSWVINRTLSQFKELQTALESEVRQIASLPPFPDLSNWRYAESHKLLEDYLQQITSTPEFCLLQSFLEFVEVSGISFNGKSEKRKEGYVYKRTGGRIASEENCCHFAKYFKRFQKRWLVLRDDLVGYLTNLGRVDLHESLNFRKDFCVESGKKDTGYSDGIIIRTSTRVLLIRTQDERTCLEWKNAILDAYNLSGWDNGEYRFRSSFPVRNGNSAKWYVDGQDYFRDVYQALNSAKSSVYITDWWLSPELHLIRPPGIITRIMDVLEMLVREKNVKVYVHVYKEVSFALSLNSYHTKATPN